MDILKGRRSLHRWAVANLVANMAIVWTGALVRLTKSGLGCPTWPQCDAGSYVPHPEAEWHAFIEFGNRLLTFVLIAIALGTAITVFRTVRARRVRMLSILIGLGIGLQGVVGGLTILAASASWVLFERPINDLKRHFRYRADTPAPQPVSHPRPAVGINVKVEGNLEA